MGLEDELFKAYVHTLIELDGAEPSRGETTRRGAMVVLSLFRYSVDRVVISGGRR